MVSRFKRMKAPALSFWLRFCTGVVVTLLLAGAAALESSRYDAAITLANRQDETLVRSLAQHAGDSFEMADLALVSVSRLVGTDARTPSRLAALNADMAEMVRRVPRLRDLFYYGENGWQLATSQAGPSTGVNQGGSDFFRHHLAVDDRKIFIGKPFRMTSGEPWKITASRRINRPDGSFGGVLMATLDSSYFSHFYSAFRIGDDTRAALFAHDGTLLARYPYDEKQIGRIFPSAAASAQSENDGLSSTGRIVSPIDGSERLSASRKVEGLPLKLLFSVPFKGVIGPWQEALPIRVPIVLGLAALLIFSGLRLAANAQNHQTSEAHLFRLARTDALTGLRNRRSFDESIQSAWQRCRASGLPLSVLMIDVDCFKGFNDAHGHPAGDLCLQIIATAVQQSVRLPDNLVVRYGGEEMAVVLPDTSSAMAFGVAERIRMSIIDLGVPNRNSTAADCLTVSIGCSTAHEPSPASGPADLLADADRALYQAKARGRNQVVASRLDGGIRPQSPSSRPPHQVQAAA